jgi:hypothetical protein
MAGSRMMAWTSGSAIARLRTSSGFEFTATEQDRYPSRASWNTHNHLVSKASNCTKVTRTISCNIPTYSIGGIQSQGLLVCRNGFAMLLHALKNLTLSNPSFNCNKTVSV